MYNSFYTKLLHAWKKYNSLVCVGLDTDILKIPLHLQSVPEPFYTFNKSIVDATAPYVCGYKIQIAYYSAYGAELQVEKTIDYILKNYPDLVVILDAKRNDIGDTAHLYAKEAFDRYKADAVTVNPYLGTDSIDPFLQRKDKGIIILCKTSNKGSGDFQNNAFSDGTKLYEAVAQKAYSQWNYNHNVLLVIGATYPAELKRVRELTPDFCFLVPGIGAQGASVKEAIENGKNTCGTGLIINSSRAILYASNQNDFAHAAQQKTIELRDQINCYR